MKYLLIVLFTFFSHATSAAVTDSIKVLVADFDSVVYMTEHDYAPFKFKVTKENKKEYAALKKQLVKDVKLCKRTWQDAVCAYVGWFGDNHFFPYGNNDIYTNYQKYCRKQLNYNTLMDEYRPKPMSCKVDDDTWLIRYPSCSIESKWMELSVREYMASGCSNLIIDIRGNGGGQDDNYMPLMQVLYDNPDNKRDGSIMRYTAASIRRCEWTEEDLIDIGYPTDISHAPEYIVKMEDGMPLRFDSVSSLPKKAAVIIDNANSSSAEQLILDARSASRRTRIYGRDNSAGCIDTGNCVSYIPKNHRMSIQYPTTYSTRWEKGTCVDPTGIAPDVRINLPYPKRLTDNIDEWVLWVAKDLKR
ncbi:MAG: hypothetical protein IJR86_02505 [Bacteroidaceae bacterium]|nr:hypothetical protein [Bacteroidaceae bacterium]